jgi:hypothetical protein
MLMSCKLKQFLFFKVIFFAALALIAGIITWVIMQNSIAMLIGLAAAIVIVLPFLSMLILPPRMVICEDSIKLREFRFFGISVDEQSVSYSKIALVKKGEGLFFSTIIIETSGGDRDLKFTELTRSDARKGYDLIEKLRKQSPGVN